MYYAASEDAQNGAVCVCARAEGGHIPVVTSRGHHQYISEFILPHLRKFHLRPCTCHLHLQIDYTEVNKLNPNISAH